MALKRTNVFLEENTIGKLNEIAKKMDIGYWNSLTASDLIRFALRKVYGLHFTSIHVYEGRIEEGLKKVVKGAQYEKIKVSKD